MAKVVPLFSGSKGNSYYIGSSGEGVLIDAGRTCRQLEEKIALNGINISSIGAVFITHEHVDHCQGLRVFAKKHKIKVYASEGTLSAMEEKGYISPEISTDVISDETVVGNMKVVRCNTPHDARESCCYQVFTSDGRRATIATDLGVMTDEVRELLRTSDFSVVESNHDIQMLRNGYYPPMTKARILSDRGHLSNDACAEELADFIRCGNFRIMLGHISENNNIPELAVNTSLNTLASVGMKQGVDFTLAAVPSESDGTAVIF